METIGFFFLNFRFSLALGGGGFDPRTPLYSEYWIINLCLGGRPANFRKKLKWQEENLGKNHKNSLASGAPAPNPRSDRIFNYYYIFVQIRPKNSRDLWKVITFLVLHDRIRKISCNCFYLRGGSAPEPPPL